MHETHGGLNLKKTVLQHVYAFWHMLLFWTILNLCIFVLSNTYVYLIWIEILSILFFTEM